MKLVLSLLVALFLHRRLHGLILPTTQKGNLFTQGIATSSNAAVFSNFGNVDTASLQRASAFPATQTGLAATNPYLLGVGSSGYGLQALQKYASIPSIGRISSRLGFGGGGAGVLGPGYPGLKGPQGFPGGFAGHGSQAGYGFPALGYIFGKEPVFRRHKPQLLTCLNFGHSYNKDGYTVGALSVTITEKHGGPGGYGDVNFGFGDLHGRNGKLSIDLTVRVEGANGRAEVVFTDQAAVSEGCSKKNLGGIFTGQDDAFGLFGKFSIFGGFGKRDDGVITSLTLSPNQAIAVHKDNLDIKNINHLAGRGVAVVTSVKIDDYGEAEIDGDILACCALAYDKKARSLPTDAFPLPGHEDPQNGFDEPRPTNYPKRPTTSYADKQKAFENSRAANYRRKA